MKGGARRTLLERPKSKPKVHFFVMKIKNILSRLTVYPGYLIDFCGMYFASKIEMQVRPVVRVLKCNLTG